MQKKKIQFFPNLFAELGFSCCRMLLKPVNSLFATKKVISNSQIHSGNNQKAQ